MAFQNKNLSVIAYCNGFTYWHYVTIEDSFKEVCEPGYFNRIKDLMAIGDLIVINTSETTDTLYVKGLPDVTLAKQGE